MFSLKVGKSLKRAHKGVCFLIKLQVESLELYEYLTPTNLLFQGFSLNLHTLTQLNPALYK